MFAALRAEQAQDHAPMPEPLADRIAVIECVLALVLADAAWKARPKPRKPPSSQDRAMLALIVAVAPDDQLFQCGDLTDDPDTAKLWGEVLARLKRTHSPVDGYEIERLNEVGHPGAAHVAGALRRGT